MHQQDQLHNLKGPVLNENAGPFVKIIKNFKMVTEEHSMEGPSERPHKLHTYKADNENL